MTSTVTAVTSIKLGGLIMGWVTPEVKGEFTCHCPLVVVVLLLTDSEVGQCAGLRWQICVTESHRVTLWLFITTCICYMTVLFEYFSECRPSCRLIVYLDNSCSIFTFFISDIIFPSGKYVHCLQWEKVNM